MRVLFTNTFERAAKKLQRKQITQLEDAIDDIIKNPLIGELKKGDLSQVYVHKFRINKQLTLIAYTYNQTSKIITLLSLGSHENFYRDLKK